MLGTRRSTRLKTSLLPTLKETSDGEERDSDSASALSDNSEDKSEDEKSAPVVKRQRISKRTVTTKTNTSNKNTSNANTANTASFDNTTCLLHEQLLSTTSTTAMASDLLGLLETDAALHHVSILQLFLSAAGCSTVLSLDVLEMDPESFLSTMSLDFTQDPPIRKAAYKQRFKALFQAVGQQLLWKEEHFLDSLQKWILTCTWTGFKWIRWAATLACLSLWQSLLQHRHLDQQVMTNWLDWFFKCIFMHRYRDVEFMIREACLQVLCQAVLEHPQRYLDNIYLRYFAWQLNDPHGSVRETALHCLIECYDATPSHATAMRALSQRFMKRVQEMASLDDEVKVRVKALNYLLLMKQHGLLSEEDETALFDFLLDEQDKVSQLALSMLDDNENDDDDSSQLTWHHLPLNWLQSKSLQEKIQFFMKSSKRFSLPSSFDLQQVQEHLSICIALLHYWKEKDASSFHQATSFIVEHGHELSLLFAVQQHSLMEWMQCLSVIPSSWREQQTEQWLREWFMFSQERNVLQKWSLLFQHWNGSVTVWMTFWRQIMQDWDQSNNLSVDDSNSLYYLRRATALLQCHPQPLLFPQEIALDQWNHAMQVEQWNEDWFEYLKWLFVLMNGDHSNIDFDEMIDKLTSHRSHVCLPMIQLLVMIGMKSKKDHEWNKKLMTLMESLLLEFESNENEILVSLFQSISSLILMNKSFTGLIHILLEKCDSTFDNGLTRLWKDILSERDDQDLLLKWILDFLMKSCQRLDLFHSVLNLIHSLLPSTMQHSIFTGLVNRIESQNSTPLLESISSHWSILLPGIDPTVAHHSASQLRNLIKGKSLSKYANVSALIKALDRVGVPVKKTVKSAKQLQQEQQQEESLFVKKLKELQQSSEKSSEMEDENQMADSQVDVFEEKIWGEEMDDVDSMQDSSESGQGKENEDFRSSPLPMKRMKRRL